jgi:hypothetical protein
LVLAGSCCTFSDSESSMVKVFSVTTMMAITEIRLIGRVCLRFTQQDIFYVVM